jgi:hypothetical protein
VICLPVAHVCYAGSISQLSHLNANNNNLVNFGKLYAFEGEYLAAVDVLISYCIDFSACDLPYLTFAQATISAVIIVNSADNLL